MKKQHSAVNTLIYSLFLFLLILPFGHTIYTALATTQSLSNNSDFQLISIANSVALLYFLQFFLVVVSSSFLYLYATNLLFRYLERITPVNNGIILSLVCTLSYCSLLVINQNLYPSSEYRLYALDDNQFFYGIAIITIIAMLITLAIHHYKSFIACTIIVAITSFSFPTSPTSKKPNIFLIGIDSLRPELIHQYMPYLSEQLSKSILFEEAYTPFARTYPAWMSIVTGRHPASNGARFNLQPESMLATDNVYLPKVLEKQGYTTIYASDERRFSNMGFAQGFKHVLGPRTGVSDFVLGDYSDFPTTNLLLLTPLGKWLLPELYGNRAAEHLYRPQAFSSLLEYELSNKVSENPLLLATHFCLPHWPYTFVGSYKTPSYTVQPYYPSNLKAVDKQIQNLMDFLAGQDLLKNSIIVFLSDHGESWGHFKTPLKNKNGKIYESWDYGHGMNILSPASHRVLMAFKGIEIYPSHLDSAVSLTDITPTILSALGLLTPEISARLDGKNLNGPKQKETEIAFESGVILSTANTANPDPTTVAKEGAHRFKINESGYLRLKEEKIQEMINRKQIGLRIDKQSLFLIPREHNRSLMLIDHVTEEYKWLTPKDYNGLNDQLITPFCRLYKNIAHEQIRTLCQ